MSSANSKDFFSSFLAAAADSPRPDIVAPAFPTDAGVERTLLSFLARREAPTPMKELLGQIEVAPSLAIGALQRLAGAKLVEIQTTDKDECVVMTDLGRRVGG